eukprot:scaffold7971_cov98-Skeletonema_menzelii.AAC.4
MKKLLAATVILSGHWARAALNFTPALSDTKQILPELCSDNCDTSSCKCMEEAYGNPELCVSEIDSTCKAEGFRGCIPEEQLRSTQNIYCRFSACVLD